MLTVVLPVCRADVDECATQRGLCRNGQCVNTVGTFLCVCNDGYELTLDGRLCGGKEMLFVLFWYWSNYDIDMFYNMYIYIIPFLQILMNVQWIQAHVVQELAWIWMVLTGVSAHLATTFMRKPVKVERHKSHSFRVVVKKKNWEVKNKNYWSKKNAHRGEFLLTSNLD